MQSNYSITTPLRICDIGGLCDTWFAKSGNILNIGIKPLIKYKINIQQSKRNEAAVCVYNIFNNEQYSIKNPTLVYNAINKVLGNHPLKIDISVETPFPLGIGLGGSASICVALVLAINSYYNKALENPDDVERYAHRIEGNSSGIQDYISAARGGIQFIEMHQYPEASIKEIELKEEFRKKLDERLLLIYSTDKKHNSYLIHSKIEHLLKYSDKSRSALHSLSILAKSAYQGLLDQSIDDFGNVMYTNTLYQKELCDNIVPENLYELYRLSKQYDILGYKVNGAGGIGASATVLLGNDMDKNSAYLRQLQNKNICYSHISISKSGAEYVDE